MLERASLTPACDEYPLKMKSPPDTSWRCKHPRKTGWVWGYMEKETNCPSLTLGHYDKPTLQISIVCLIENYTRSWTIKTEDDPFIKKKKKEKEKLHTRGKSICSGTRWGKKDFT